MSSKRRLHRSQEDKILAGVCGGIADHLDVDPTLVRLGVFLATVFSGGFLIPLIYIALAVVLPVSHAGLERAGEPEEMDALDDEVVDAEFSDKEVDAWGLEPAGVKPAKTEADPAEAADDGAASTGGNAGAASLGGSA